MSLVLTGNDSENGLFPKEKGRLHILDQHFYTEDNQLWSWRGYSWFLGYYRFCKGEDLTDDLKFFRANGINVVRVFGPLSSAWDLPEYEWQRFDITKLGAFFDLLAEWGIRVEFVPLCYGEDRGFPKVAQKALVLATYAIAEGRWNVFIEVSNEPHRNNINPAEIMVGVSTHGVLSSFGEYQFVYDGSRPKIALDYITLHTERDSAWHRKARHCQETAHKLNKPCVSDEPAKIVEPSFDYPGAKNDPKRTPQEAAWHFGVLALWTPGGTFHCEAGKWGRIPDMGTLQRSALDSVRDNVWTRLDSTWQSGKYNGSDSSASPVDDVNDADGNPIWTYTSLGSKRAASVRCGIVDSEIKSRGGWTITDRWGPNNTFVTLTRS